MSEIIKIIDERERQTKKQKNKTKNKDRKERGGQELWWKSES